MLEKETIATLEEALQQLECQFAALPAVAGQALPPANPESLSSVLRDVAERLRDNYPYFHPLYAGQMLKPPHPIARAAYALATWINPNNHALDGGRATSAMEKEAVAEIAAMFGWQEHLGHLTGGGTMANLEALWVAGRLSAGRTIVASPQSHYTHERISAVLGLPFAKAAVDPRGRMDVESLEALAARGDVGCVVATLGTTGVGAVDPLPEILRLREKFGFRVHVDSAYGGYFTLAGNLRPETRMAFDRIGEADSIVIDPHKHGLQPYGCGCVLFRDPAVGALYKHDSPYTYFSSRDLHLGEISLECSRPGASAAALWTTMRVFPLERGGAFARRLEAGRDAALELHRRLASDPRFLPAFRPELDIVVWMVRGRTATESSAKARGVFDEAARRGLHLAVAELPAELFDLAGAAIERDRDTVTCLRSVLMKPEHREWIGRIWEIL